jgi:UDP-N-acetyl-D-galactosamine dehydrogenase
VLDIGEIKLATVGLGYVGLPLTILLATKFDITGYDRNAQRIEELWSGFDRTREVEKSVLVSTRARFTSDTKDIAGCNFYIVAVPTPVDEYKKPDMEAVLSACETVGRVLSVGNVVVFESTVYPGATEEECVPVLEKVSGLRYNHDFFVGYSPERVNPGDKQRTIDKIVKVTSGSTPEAARLIDQVYASVVAAGTYPAESIRVAEAAKVIENVQRDVNIALVNELALLFDRLGIDTLSVLNAAGTKWNFLPFRPGLVGGHCIGVDPYYLTYRAEKAGFHTEVILAGRRINDSMAEVVASRFVKRLSAKGLPIANARVAVLGITFKEDCPDIRNTKAVDIVRELESYGIRVDVYDPEADAEETLHEHRLALAKELGSGPYDGILIAVGHAAFHEMGAETLRRIMKPEGVLFDVKGIFAADAVDLRL